MTYYKVFIRCGGCFDEDYAYCANEYIDTGSPDYNDKMFETKEAADAAGEEYCENTPFYYTVEEVTQ